MVEIRENGLVGHFKLYLRSIFAYLSFLAIAKKPCNESSIKKSYDSTEIISQTKKNALNSYCNPRAAIYCAPRAAMYSK